MEHTPGPWRCFKNLLGNYTVKTDANGIRDYIGEAEQEANARLIVAAPELLHALKMARAWLINQKIDMEKMPKGLNSFEELEEIIAKAEAKQ